MECTQRLEFTQELYETHTEKVCPEQIGFLGICGAKHPVLKGPNKIGRDPQTCSIVLNLNSVSRQHAVINVLSSKEFMLMDLDSANKTKLLNKVLQPYIPHPIRNGDTVQFGDIFGIFRLLEDNDELPMTQAIDLPMTQRIDIPETPAPTRHVSKLTKATTTMIPESPDVSDRDDSFTAPSRSNETTTRLSSGQFIKPFGKTLSIQPISSPKNDISRNSSKRSISFVDPNTSLNESLISLKVDKNADNIHEMDTQVPYPVTIPTANESTDSIYMADTQIPPGHGLSPSIHSLNTQIPEPSEHLPQVRKINNQQDMQFDIFAANKENDLSIFNAETQPFICEKEENKTKTPNKADPYPKSVKSLNKSEEELLFDEIVDDCFEDFNSQPLLPQESPTLPLKCNKESPKQNAIIESDDEDIVPTQKVQTLPIEVIATKEEKNKSIVPSKRCDRIKSDSSTDCEDIDLTQKIPALPVKIDTKEDKLEETNKNAVKRINRIDSGSSTDCEDLDIIPTQIIPAKKPEDADKTFCEDEVDEIGKKQANRVNTVDVTEFEDMATQVIDLDPEKVNKVTFENMDTQIIGIDENAATKPNDSFEDQATQIIDEIVPNNSKPAKENCIEVESPFKIPLQSPIRVKSKEIMKAISKDKPDSKDIDVDNYYNDTQDILDDLCTQRQGSPILMPKSSKSPIVIDDEFVPCSVEDYKVGDKFANIDQDLSPVKSLSDQKAKKNATTLSSQEVRNVIGVDAPVDKLKKIPSDSSDVDSTPKKVRSLVFTDSDLPNSQEIKTNVCAQNHTKSYATASSSESEPEMNTEESQGTPFVYRKKKTKPSAKIDLTKKFVVEKLPERIITRVRKPTSKLEDSTPIDKKVSANILKAKFLTEQEDQIDQDIITENVKKLKTYAKAKSSKEVKVDLKIKEDKNSSTHNEEKKISKTNLNKSDSKVLEDKNDSALQQSINNSTLKQYTKQSKSKEHKNDTKVVENISKESINESKSQVKSETKTRQPKEKIRVKIERPKRKDTDASSSKDGETSKRKSKKESIADTKSNESSRKSKDESTTQRSRRRSPAAKSKDTSRRSDTDKLKDSTHSTSDIKVNTRSTRSRRKVNETKPVETEVVVIEDEKAEPVETKKRRYNRKKEVPKESVSPEMEVRRSRRQVKLTEKVLDSLAPKSILKKSTHEQSTVYNVSSGGESPRHLKRSLGDESDAPSPKRTRAFVNNVNNNVSINNGSLRSTPSRAVNTHKVLFTAFPSEEVKHKLEKLGAVIVSDVVESTVVLTMQVKRTFKLLCAVGLGRPIVGPSWVQACVDNNIIVDPWLYLIKDEAAETRFQFNLEKTLNGKRNFLKGYNVSSTPSVQPNATEMKLIVECSGGIWKEGGTNWVCVSSTKDQILWSSLRKRGAIIVSTEFILGGVLRQKLEIIANKFP